MCSTIIYAYTCGHSEETTYPCARFLKKSADGANPRRDGCPRSNRDHHHYPNIANCTPQTGNSSANATATTTTRLDQPCHDCEEAWEAAWRRRRGIRRPLPERANGGVRPREENRGAAAAGASGGVALQRRGRAAAARRVRPAAGRRVRSLGENGEAPAAGGVEKPRWKEGVRPLETNKLSNVDVPGHYGFGTRLRPSVVFNFLQP